MRAIYVHFTGDAKLFCDWQLLFQCQLLHKKKRIRYKQLTEVICILNKVMELAIFFFIFFSILGDFVCLFVCLI